MLKVLMPSMVNLVSIDYESIKSQETELIIKRALRIKPSISPKLMQVSGVPGAGKSTYCKIHKSGEYLYLSFDEIMVSLQGYQQELLLNGMQEAFKKYEMTARVIGYELLNRAIKKRINIMFEHSGTNDAHLELFRNITTIGYKTVVNFILCDTQEALKRTKERSILINRHVPDELVLERAKKVYDYIEKYQTIASQVNLLDGINNFALLKKI